MFKLTESSSVFLNIIRAFFSQMVLVGHALSFLGLQQYFTSKHIPQIQSISVSILFLLSGFLTIYSSSNKMSKNESYAFKDFFKNRFFRFYSVLIPGLLVIVLIDSLNILFFRNQFEYFTSFNIKTFISNMLMLQDFPLFKVFKSISTTSFGSARPLWTLPIEWFLYMTFGFFFFKLYKTGKKENKIIVLVSFLFIIIVPYTNFILGRGNGLTFTWFLGVVIFYLLKKQTPFTKNSSLFLFFVSATSACLRIFSAQIKWGLDYDPLFSFMCALSIYFGILFFTSFNWKRKVIAISSILSKFSFSLYITHYSLLIFLNNWLLDSINIYTLLIIEIIVCNLFAYVFYLLFESKLYNKLIRL